MIPKLQINLDQHAFTFKANFKEREIDNFFFNYPKITFIRLKISFNNFKL